MSLHVAGSILTLSLAASPAPRAIDTLKDTECASEGRTVEALRLSGGGEVETVFDGASVRMNFYLDGERVLTVSEMGGRVDTEITEYGSSLSPERAAQFRDEVVSNAQAIMDAPTTGCISPLAGQADESAKCNLIGIGAGVLGAIAGATLGGGVGGVLGGAAASSLGALCNWLVAKVCEENSEGC